MSEQAKILFVEDEKNLALTLRERLEDHGYQVVWASHMSLAQQYIGQDLFDLLIVDIGLPDGSGFELAQTVRKTQPTCAVVFLTALSDAESRIEGLRLGAEDYITKPFYLEELLLRIRNALKRRVYLEKALHNQLPEPYYVGDVKVFFKEFRVEKSGKSYSLTHKEAALLRYLVEHRGQVVSRDELLHFVWGGDEQLTSTRTIDNFVMRLRRLIEHSPQKPNFIHSVRGVGYQLI